MEARVGRDSPGEAQCERGRPIWSETHEPACLLGQRQVTINRL